MALKGINRALIYTTLERGLRDMKTDLKRTIRNLTDLGSQFAKTPQQETVFAVFRSLLERGNSPYYTMIQNLLDNSSEKDLLTFGMNIACNSWIDRKHSKAEHAHWIVFPDENPFRSDIASFDAFVSEQKAHGVYSYVFDEETSLTKEFFHLIRKHRDCAFFYLKDSCALTKEIFDEIAHTHNLMMVLNGDNARNLTDAEALRRQKSLYCTYTVYHKDDVLSDTALLEPARKFRSAFHVLFADGSCPAELQKNMNARVNAYRMAPSDPILLIDAYTDVSALEEWLEP